MPSSSSAGLFGRGIYVVAAVWRMTASGVRHRRRRSRPSVQLRAYATSISSASPKLEFDRAATCQSPVSPARYEEALEVVRREVLRLVRDARTGADERHVALDAR